jgi:hypothetical protein
VLSSTSKFHNGIGITSMNPHVLLMVCLLSLYVAAMMIFWHSIARQKSEARLDTTVRLALQEGQTIVGVEETAQGMELTIGDYVRDEKYRA